VVTHADNLARARRWINGVRYDGRPCACRLHGVGAELGQWLCLECGIHAILAAVRAKGEADASVARDWGANEHVGEGRLTVQEFYDQYGTDELPAALRAHAADVPPVPS